MEGLEKYLLEEVIEKKEEIKKLKEEKDSYTEALNVFRNVLISVVQRWHWTDGDDKDEKVVSFGLFSNKKDTELYNTLEKFAKDLGVIKDEE